MTMNNAELDQTSENKIQVRYRLLSLISITLPVSELSPFSFLNKNKTINVEVRNNRKKHGFRWLLVVEYQRGL